MNRPAEVPAAAVEAAWDRTRGADDIWRMAGNPTMAGRAARRSLVGVVLDAAVAPIRRSAFRLDETPEIRATLARALADAITLRRGDGHPDSTCYDADQAETYEAVAAVLGLDTE